MASPEWYYAKANKQHGPVSAAELKKLVDQGELKPGDLVWREGLEDWIPARNDPVLKKLFGQEAPAPPPKVAKTPPRAVPPGGPPVFRKAEAAFDRSGQRSVRHVFDLLIDFARAQFTTQFIDLTSKIFTLGGHYGLYAAMALLFVFSMFLGVKANQVNTILLGLGGIVILVVLQYVSGRFFGALERLNASTPGRVSSTAFLDCFALLNMLGGLVALLGLAVLAVQTGWLSLILFAIATFILCQYVAVLALNPGALSLTVGADVSAGEEAIGILSFLVKLSLRLVPVAFGVGIVWGSLGLLYACFLVLAPPDEPERIMELAGVIGAVLAMTIEDPSASEEAMRMLPAQASAIKASAILIDSAALPFLAYLYFLIYYLSIDVLRAILSLPGKLDKMSDKG